MRYLLLILWVGAVQVAMARWFEPPVTISEGVTILGHFDTNPEHSTIHLRIAVPNDHSVQWGLVWNANDDDFVRATIALPAKYIHDDIYKPTATVTVERVTDDATTTIANIEVKDGIDIEGHYNSLKLVTDEGRAFLWVGSSDPIKVGEVPAAGAGDFLIFTEADAKCQRIDINHSDLPKAPKSQYTDFDALVQHLNSSTDPMEGCWEYMDRNMSEDRATLGGFYTLATVREGKGYTLLYIKGAKINGSTWVPLDVKGRLMPTIFKGNYDMEWIDANHHLLDEDVNAQLSDDGAILTLRFPLLDTQVRMRRLQLTDE